MTFRYSTTFTHKSETMITCGLIRYHKPTLYLLSLHLFSPIYPLPATDSFTFPLPAINSFTTTMMATSASLLKLEEQLKCPVCLGFYNNPKTLPCLHSFCQSCLEGLVEKGLPQDLWEEDEESYLFCPTCRQCTEVPREGVGAFPVAFTLNSFKEIILSLRKQSDQQQVTSSTCTDHDKPLEVFCETCETVICFHCAVRTHKDHKYDLVSDCYLKYYRMLHDNLKPVKEKKEALAKVLSDLAEREGEIRERGEGVLEEVREMVEEMIGILRQSEKKLTEQVKRVTDAKLEVLSRQTKSAQISLKLLEDVENYVESLTISPPQQVLSSKKQMMKCMSEVTTQVNVEEFKPKKDILRLIKNKKTLESLNQIGTLSFASLQECKVKITDFQNLQNDASFSLSLEAPDSSLVPVPHSSIKCSLVCKRNQLIHATVTSTRPGVYLIHCNPSTSGTHTVKVQVGKIQLKDTSIVIPFNPYLKNITPVGTITELQYPRRVAVCDDGHVIIVTEKKRNSITIMGSEDKCITLEISNPAGVIVTPDDCILASNCSTHNIIKVSSPDEDNKIATVGKKGNGLSEFNAPDGIAISPITGQVYIADVRNHRIQVLNPDLTFSHSFGKKGSANGHFKLPSDIAIDSQGLVYVADTHNNRIQKFSPNGWYITQFSNIGTGGGKLHYPMGITIDATGLVYVSEFRIHRISVFTGDGTFVNSFKNGFCRPIGITFDNEGYFYVCDSGNDQIKVY